MKRKMDEEGEEIDEVEDMRSIVRKLVETPLFTNSELKDNNVLKEDANLAVIMHKQMGIFDLMRGGFGMQKRVLAENSSFSANGINPSIYDEKMKKLLESEENVVAV